MLAAGDVATAAAWNVITNDVIDHETRINDAGLTIITPTSVSGSGVSFSNGQVSLSATTAATINGIFSSTYKNYRIALNLTTAGQMSLQLAASGTPNATAGDYRWGLINVASNIATVNSDFSATASTSFPIPSVVGQASYMVEIYNPFATANTIVSYDSGYFNTSTQFFMKKFCGGLIVTTSYDGIKLNLTSATGTVSVYGYTQS